MNNTPSTYQSCKMFRYTGELLNQVIYDQLKNNKEIKKDKTDKNNKEGKKISTVIVTLTNIKREKNGIVFDFIQHKQIRTPDYHPQDFEEIDFPYKIYISGEDKTMIIFGSFTGNSVPNMIFDILHPTSENEYYFEDIFFEPKIMDKIIRSILDDDKNKVKLFDPRFVFGKEKFQKELRYAKFSLGHNTCFTDSELYKEGLDICTTLEPIFEITKCVGLADDDGFRYTKNLYVTNYGKFWFRGVFLDYLKWLDFLFTYCSILTPKNDDNN